MSLISHLCGAARHLNVSGGRVLLLSNRTISLGNGLCAEEAKAEELYSINVDDDENELLEEKMSELERKRNKSRLNPGHQNMVHNKMPYDIPLTDYHETINYKRRMFGRYGRSSQVDPSTLWPTDTELKETHEYESVAHALSFHDLVRKAQEKVDEERRRTEQRQKTLDEGIAKLEMWKKEVTGRAAKKLAEAEAARVKKEELIEEVRRHFGYKVSPKNEQFKEMLALKEKQQRKELKEQKTKLKQERMAAAKDNTTDE